MAFRRGLKDPAPANEDDVRERLAEPGTERTKATVGRRFALRAVLAGAAAAAGATVVGIARPGKASANGPTVFTSNSSAIPVIAENTGGFVAIEATGSGGGSSYPTVSASNSDTSGVALFGESDGSGAYAVQGSSMFGYGVVGYGGTASLYGYTNSAAGMAVLGTNISSSPAIQAVNYGSGPGVQGTSSGRIGVLGVCSNDVNSVGVYAQSATGKGFLGYSNSVNGVGAVGVNSTSGIGLYGVSSGGYGGVISGNLYVTGALTVVGAKSAAVRDAGGALRRVYSMESPESWFEDFGSGQLIGGSVTVQLEPGFAGLVHGDNYHVFPVPKGDCKGLYVSNLTPGSFTVRELQTGTSNVAFSYRVVAKRKDIPGVRLEHVDEPAMPDVPSEPIKPQDIPSTPAASRHGG